MSSSSHRLASDVACQQFAVRGEGEPERIAQPVGPDLRHSAGRVDERIVVWHRTVRVEPQDLAVHVRKVLGVRVVGVHPHGPVELAVGAELDLAAMMEHVAQLVGLQEYDLGCGVGVSPATVMRDSRSWFCAVVYDT